MSRARRFCALVEELEPKLPPGDNLSLFLTMPFAAMLAGRDWTPGAELDEWDMQTRPRLGFVPLKVVPDERPEVLGSLVAQHDKDNQTKSTIGSSISSVGLFGEESLSWVPSNRSVPTSFESLGSLLSAGGRSQPFSPSTERSPHHASPDLSGLIGVGNQPLARTPQLPAFDEHDHVGAGGNGYDPDEPSEPYTPPANQAPTALNDAAQTPEDTTVTIQVLANDYDVDPEEALALDSASTPAHGRTTINTQDKTVTYTPPTDWYGTDSFTYEISDKYGATATATVSVTVAAAQDVPLAFHDALNMPPNPSAFPMPVSFSPIDLLRNDIDYDPGAVLTVSSFTQPGIGSLSWNQDGTLRYTVPAGGQDYVTTFTYVATDGQDPSNTATVYIFVPRFDAVPCPYPETCPGPYPPVANNDSYEFQGDFLSVPAQNGVLANDTDPDGDLFIAILDQHPTAGKLYSLGLDGSFNYGTKTPYPDEDLFSYFAYDSKGARSGAFAALQKYEPLLDFLGYDNTLYAYDRHALNVSNFKTHAGLQTKAETNFGSTSPDLDNFRLRVYDPKQTTNEVTVKLEVLRNGVVQPNQTANYTLSYKNGSYYRGYFLRLVSDERDDAASYHGFEMDPDNQTVLVKLGDVVRVTYGPAGGGPDLVRQLPVGRPSSEENNHRTKQWLHDIRNLKVNVVVFRKVDGSGPIATRTQVLADLETINERLAQATIRLENPSINMGGEGDPGVPLPTGSGIDWNNGFDASVPELRPGISMTAEQAAVFAHKDTDINSIDIFYTPDFSAPYNLNLAHSYTAEQAHGNAAFSNNITLTSKRTVLSIAHEVMHILLNSPHREGENAFSLLNSPTTSTKVVNGTKRIGPYPDNLIGALDTMYMRAAAEKLPQSSN